MARKLTNKEKWIRAIVDQLVAGEKSMIELKKELREEAKMSGGTLNEVIAEAKKRIKDEANDLKDISYDLNMIKLHDIADNAAQVSDSISAIDKINKMTGAYTQNINISDNIRFILGDQEAFENDFMEEDGQ